MKAFAEVECFRRGHAFSGDWGRTIDLIILIIVTSYFPTGRCKPAPFRRIASEALHSTAEIPTWAETNASGAKKEIGIHIKKRLSHRILHFGLDRSDTGEVIASFSRNRSSDIIHFGRRVLLTPMLRW